MRVMAVSGLADAMVLTRMSRATLSGCSRARFSAMRPPIEIPRIVACDMPTDFHERVGVVGHHRDRVRRIRLVSPPRAAVVEGKHSMRLRAPVGEPRSTARCHRRGRRSARADHPLRAARSTCRCRRRVRSSSIAVSRGGMWRLSTVAASTVVSASPLCAVTEVLLDAARCGKQVRQELAAHQVGAAAAHRRRHVDGGDHASGRGH